MGDCLRTVKPSQFLIYNQHQSQLSLPSLWGRQIEYRPIWLGLGHRHVHVMGGR